MQKLSASLRPGPLLAVAQGGCRLSHPHKDGECSPSLLRQQEKRVSSLCDSVSPFSPLREIAFFPSFSVFRVRGERAPLESVCGRPSYTQAVCPPPPPQMEERSSRNTDWVLKSHGPSPLSLPEPALSHSCPLECGGWGQFHGRRGAEAGPLQGLILACQRAPCWPLFGSISPSWPCQAGLTCVCVWQGGGRGARSLAWSLYSDFPVGSICSEQKRNSKAEKKAATLLQSTEAPRARIRSCRLGS